MGVAFCGEWPGNFVCAACASRMRADRKPSSITKNFSLRANNEERQKPLRAIDRSSSFHYTLLHSKLWSSRWPNLQAIVSWCREILIPESVYHTSLATGVNVAHVQAEAIKGSVDRPRDRI